MYKLSYRVPAANSNAMRRDDASNGAGRLYEMVGAAGFEPATAGLEIRCSIRLSYAPRVYSLILPGVRMISRAGSAPDEVAD